MPIEVNLDVAEGRLSDDVALTAYYVATEAFANAVKHSHAERIDVSVTRIQDQLRLRIADNGVGGASVREGGGLHGLADRVAAAGGSFSVLELTHPGTTIEAVLPCAP